MRQLVVLHQHDVSGENHGVLVQHVGTLAALLADRGWRVSATDCLHPRLAALTMAADVVVVQMLPDPEVEAIVRERRARGRATVFEITDNFLGLARDSYSLRSPLVRQHLLYHAWLCDALQVYAAGLEELFGTVNPRIVRFTPYVPIPERVPDRAAGFVLGWGGTRSHAADLAAVAPVVRTFCARHDDVTFDYMGDRSLFDDHFGSIDPARVIVRPFGDHEEYLRFVAGLRVGLAPLRPTPFNAARSDTRFGTYAAYGVAAVLEDGPVYGPRRERARLFRTPAELGDVLEELHREPDEVERLGRAARAWACAERSRDALAAERDEAYRALLGRADEAPAPGPTGEAGASAQRERLADALRLDATEALGAARRIVADDPSYEQAHLLVARSLERSGDHEAALRYVERLTPSAVYADLFAEVQIRCARRVRPGDVTRLRGGLRSPFRRALSGDGPTVDRVRAILEHQPYDHFALACAIRLLGRTDPGSPELERLYERAALVSPEDVPADRRPAALAPFLPA